MSEYKLLGGKVKKGGKYILATNVYKKRKGMVWGLAPLPIFKTMYTCSVIYLVIRNIWLCLLHTDAFRQKHCYESDQIPFKRVQRKQRETP